MSIEYDDYLTQHRENVTKGLEWFRSNLPEFTMMLDLYFIGQSHDYSKDSFEEYDAYDAYFYGGRQTKAVKEEFNQAWLHHIHHNPHHWQHWVLINDEPGEGTVALRMPTRYVIEMVCDWWAFSWAKGDLYEIFNWYDKHKSYIKLHEDTRELVEEILAGIRAKLDAEKDLKGDGINNPVKNE